jgi:DNA polymerase elongation subunit (family B)
MTPLLSGHNTEEGILAVLPAGDAVMRLYVRGTKSISTRDEEFFPFFYLAEPSLLDGFSQKFWLKKAEGTLSFTHICVFPAWPVLWDAVRHMLDRYNATETTRIESYTQLQALHLIPDPVTQFLVQTGRTMFKGMAFNDLHRLQLDIETYTEGYYRFSKATRPGDRIILIALADSRGWNHIIDGRKLDERRMLRELVRVINERDPDVIEGHNIIGFDLPYILTRCARHGVELTIGRDGSAAKTADARGSAGEYPGEPAIAGRHVVDTLHLVQSYDQTKRNMESYGLKYVARYFGFASPDRVYVQGDRISATWDESPETLVKYALDDVLETGRISEHLSPTSFYLAQMLPAPYGTVTRMGSAAKIEMLMAREYLHRKHSLPRPSQGIQTTGGYTDIFVTGVVGPVVHADVASLYPSIMIGNGIAPAKDTLGIFTAMLEELTSQRLAVKQKARAASDPLERSRLDAQQSSLKILINSFYGYLGYGRALFNDYAQADAVTTTGQEILRKIIATIREHHGTVVEVDTDGVFFVPPPDCIGEDAERSFVRTVAITLPPRIALELDGRYQRMLSYKKKNYALLGYDDRLTMKGSSLISRSIERFGRVFVRQAVERILNNDINGLHRIYVNTVNVLQGHQMSVSEFARVETLRDSLEIYDREVLAGKRNKSAAYEVARQTERRVRAGERIVYYITGTDPGVKGFENCKQAEDWDPHFPDENVAYYVKRLDEFAQKFSDFFRPQDFSRIFAPEDLFPFSAEGVEIVTTSTEDQPDEPEESTGKFGIWLDE